ncbi:aldo-keto reductase [Aspergillus ellipticus CBS 707.79]|uniref:D-xylose reductase [NAD(P)H] n=1 Tax=Aspergillus ellipticus CBS 707.79 TaxID=1448320 RepID=A0A319CR58_9EURO|nr:aldo-keto reductase [Aspergillus ellipticus CBS 707.79]
MAPLTLQSTKKMVSGYEIPAVGFGVYKTPPDVTETVTLKALQTGYRHIDSAQLYRNELECCTAIHKSGLDRSQIFYTSKVPTTHMSYEKAREAIDASLEAASELGYIDLMLLHAPYGGPTGRLGAWRALVEAQQSGKIRSIGVSNYGIKHLEELEAYIQSHGGADVAGKISVGQYEIHPWCAREDIVGWLRDRGAVVEAYSPLVQAKRMEEPVLRELARKYAKSPAQVLVRWSLQKGYVPLPKSVTESRIVENTQVFDFELSREDMDRLQTAEYAPVCWDPARDSRL